MGSLENEARNDPQGTLFKVLHFCEGLKKSVIGLESTVVELRKENALLRAQVRNILSLNAGTHIIWYRKTRYLYHVVPYAR